MIPDLRSTASGMPVLGFGVAVNDRRKNQQTGEWEDYPNFIDCTMFGARAQSVSRFLSKGSKVAIEGKLRWSQWERDGQKRSKIEVIVDEIEFMTSRNDGAPRAAATSQRLWHRHGGGSPMAAPIVGCFRLRRRHSVLIIRKRLTCLTTPSSLVESIASSARIMRNTSTTKTLRCCASMLLTVGRSSPAVLRAPCTQHQRDIANAVKRAREMAPHALRCACCKRPRRRRNR